MKSLFLSLILFCCSTGSLFSQVEIYLAGGTTNYASGQYSYYAYDTVYHTHLFHVKNTSGVAQEWFITRRRLDPPASWKDYVCWGIPVSQQNPLGGGVCVQPEDMDTVFYVLGVQGHFIIEPGDHGELITYQKPSYNDIGTYHYRYYISSPQTLYEDSLDIEVIMTPAGISDITKENVAVYPNPANDQVTISAPEAQSGVVVITDISGKVVQKQSFSQNATLNIAELKSGVYQVIIENSLGETTIKKLLIE